MKKKWAISMVSFALISALLLPACSKQDAKPSDASQKESTASPGNAVESAKPDLSPTTYSINVSDPKLTWDAPIPKTLTEKTGVSMNYLPIIGDSLEKMDIWLASEDYPDIISAKAETIEKYKQADAVIPLEGLIDQYGPHIKEKFGKFYDLLKDKDGHIYSLYNVNLTKTAPPSAQANFVVQYAVLEEAGYPEIKTLDQLYEVIKSYYAKHPTIDGQPAIPFSGIGKDGPVLVFNNPSMAAAGEPDHGNFTIDANNQTHLNLVSNANKQYFKFLNKLYNEGLLDKEIFTLGFDGAKAKLAQGRILAGFYPGWVVGGPEASLRAAQKSDREYAKLPILLNDAVTDHSNALLPTGSNENWAITKKAKNPERIIQFIDYLFSDEGQILTHWGIEGVHYEVKDGKRVQMPEAIKNAQSDPDYATKQGFNSPIAGQTNWFSVGDGALLADGDYATPVTVDSVRRDYDDKTKEVLAKYNKQTWADFLSKPYYVPAFLWQLTPTGDISLAAKKIDDAMLKNGPKVILADAADFDGAWDKYAKSIQDAGQKTLEDGYTKLWQEAAAKYNALK